MEYFKSRDFILSLAGWLILLALVYFLYAGFFSEVEQNGFSFSKNLTISFALAGGIAFVSLFPLLGMPGAVLLSLSPLLGFSSSRLEGDRAWPAAIITSILWPFSLPAALGVKQYLLHSPYADYANTGFLSAVATGILLTVFTVNLFGKKM